MKPLIIGSYSEGDSISKVKADIDRMLGLLKIIKEEKPDLLIAYPNPPAARVAYGVGIPYIAITDSPHSEVPSRLSLPLATAVIFSECIPTQEIRKYTYEKASFLMPYGGIDEITWLLRTKPNVNYVRSLGLKEWNYVIIRPHERFATYYKDLVPRVDLHEIIHALSENDLTAVIIPRYRDHLTFANELKRKGLRIKIIQEMYDGVSLSFYARCVISGGSTLAREAALLMTEGITYFPKDLYVNKCVMEKGYPLHKALTTDEILDIVERIPDKKKVRHDEVINKLGQDFEDIIPVILKSIDEVVRD